MKFRVNKKSGFSCNESPVVIYDHRGVFYYNPNKKGSLFFNLPPGTYITENNLKPSPVVSYSVKTLPTPERKMMKPKKIKIIKGDNPSKCTIFLDKGLIFIDKKLSEKINTPALTFIIFHELGHYYYGGHKFGSPAYYKAEKKCDEFATFQMIRAGFNPSQIYIGSEISLSGNKRKKDNFNLTKKIHSV